ncbi:phosphate signaling complex protein PhoU [Thiocystis violacea]|uniref:phosphate signaling complex protein PhoU n=1 Tax=Thiocystis violacea TaxID=13725 RepID=UPI001907F0CA|nr:phosphate signaling complex protein PhoU [Thiocystis violacea]MBK1724100.1 phosphate transport system regulatory protein PhoU [Thiocystis violacea]
MTDSHSLVEKKREALTQGIIELAGLVDTALRTSLDALRRQDLGVAEEIVGGDTLINRGRRVLEQQAMVVLAAHQPAARDFRLIGASLEMITEIERIADHAADVARILLIANGRRFPEVPLAKVLEMGDAAAAMFRDVMAAYAEGARADSARAAVLRENAVDAQERSIIEDVAAWLCQGPRAPMLGVELLWIAHHYERIADRATNIAERVVYIETGETPDLD